MNTLKKLLSVFAVVAMVLSMTVSANAATVTVKEGLDGHTFGYYQILKGTQTTGDASLGEPAWGTGINDASFVAELDDITEFAGVTDAATFVQALAANTDKAEQVARIAYKHKKGEPTAIAAGTVEIAAGYYLIVDTTTLQAGDAKNAALLQITEKDAIEIGNKTTKPTVDKFVSRDGVWQKSTDAYIGETVTMKITAEVPSMEHYDSYYVKFVDDADASFNAITVASVKLIGTVNSTANTDVALKTTEYVHTPNNEDFTLVINDLKALAAAKNMNTNEKVEVVVEYTTALNKAADLGNRGNLNKVKLVYTANPDDGLTGETTEKTVYVFTYQLDGTKVDGANTATKLPGAKFKLKKGENEFYKVTNGIVSWVAEGEATEVTSDDNGLFNFIGLDQGTYTLIETVAPQGYNKANSTVTITATLNDTSITVLNTETTEEILNAGKVSVQVENNKGAVLPETGGIGTTMFYIIGAALVIGAGVVLVSKKRMEVK